MQILHLLTFLAIIKTIQCFLRRITNRDYNYRVYATVEEMLIHANELTSPNASFISIQTPTPNNDKIVDETSADGLTSAQFGSVFTQCAPYIAQHRGTIIVIHLPSKLFHKDKKDLFEKIMDDISILHLLGVQLVLIAGI